MWRGYLVFFVLWKVSQQNLLFLNLNQKCNSEHETWICQKSTQCQGLKEGIKNGTIEICSFIREEPIVCCPPFSPLNSFNNKTSITFSENNGRIGGNKNETTGVLSLKPYARTKAEKMCQEYAKYVYREIKSPLLIEGSENMKVDECATPTETLIVGGSLSKLNEFPHMALIGVKYNHRIEWFCGGSLISPRFILSAAHCNVSKYRGKAIARLGDLDILDPDDGAKPMDVKIAEVFDHPKYDHRWAYHDISLLKMERDITLGPSIRPLCLNTKRSLNPDKAIASGWGRTSYGGKPSTILQKVLLDLVNEQKCNRIYSFSRTKLPEGIIPDIMFCAGGVNGKDTCQGDSGGPLQVYLQDAYCMYLLIGVTSFGVNCSANIPGGYTRISSYVPWIESVVWH